MLDQEIPLPRDEFPTAPERRQHATRRDKEVVMTAQSTIWDLIGKKVPLIYLAISIAGSVVSNYIVFVRMQDRIAVIEKNSEAGNAWRLKTDTAVQSLAETQGQMVYLMCQQVKNDEPYFCAKIRRQMIDAGGQFR